MPPSLTRPSYDAAPQSFGEHTPAPDERLSIGAAAAVILGLSVAAWIIVIQATQMVRTLLG